MISNKKIEMILYIILHAISASQTFSLKLYIGQHGNKSAFFIQGSGDCRAHVFG